MRCRLWKTAWGILRYWFMNIRVKNATSQLSLGPINNAATVSVSTQQMNNTLVPPLFMRDSTCSTSAVLYLSHRKICSSSVQAIKFLHRVVEALHWYYDVSPVELQHLYKSSQSITNGKCLREDNYHWCSLMTWIYNYVFKKRNWYYILFWVNKHHTFYSGSSLSGTMTSTESPLRPEGAPSCSALFCFPRTESRTESIYPRQ